MFMSRTSATGATQADAGQLLARLARRMHLKGRHLLILGCDSLALDLHALARGVYGMEVTAISLPDGEIGPDLARADIVALHDGAPDFGDHQLNAMRADAWLLAAPGANTRIDSTAVMHALWFSTIGGMLSFDAATTP